MYNRLLLINTGIKVQKLRLERCWRHGGHDDGRYFGGHGSPSGIFLMARRYSGRWGDSMVCWAIYRQVYELLLLLRVLVEMHWWLLLLLRLRIWFDVRHNSGVRGHFWFRKVKDSFIVNSSWLNLIKVSSNFQSYGMRERRTDLLLATRNHWEFI